MMKTENIYQEATLLEKALLGELDREEQQALEKLLQEKPELGKLFDHLQQPGNAKQLLDEYRHYSSRRAYLDFLSRTSPVGKPHQRNRMMRWWCSAAAAVVLAVGVSFWMQQTTQELNLPMSTSLIAPGEAKAALVLPDGQVIDVHRKEVNVDINGMKVTYKKGVLAYEKTTHEERETDQEVTMNYNKLVIPHGGENTVILSDGSKVHLNAGSKLVYPVKFVGKERRVSLEGEAYFDVTDDSQHPFVVETRLGNVNVLGTAFNVNAYNDEQACYTTLVRGKVTFETTTHRSVTLLPGQQAIATAAGGVDKKEVNLDEYVGWVSGLYVFKEKRLGELMKTFSKWYDISVLYETPALKELAYSGNLKRYDTINTFLDALTLTGDLTYKINGKKILIYEIDKD